MSSVCQFELFVARFLAGVMVASEMRSTAGFALAAERRWPWQLRERRVHSGAGPKANATPNRSRSTSKVTPHRRGFGAAASVPPALHGQTAARQGAASRHARVLAHSLRETPHASR